MTIDFTTEKTVPITQAAQLFPEPQPSIRTLWRYTLHGRRGIKLESMTTGTHRVTTKAAVNRFLEAINAPTAPKKAGRTGKTPMQRRKEAEAANAMLDREGL